MRNWILVGLSGVAFGISIYQWFASNLTWGWVFLGLGVFFLILNWALSPKMRTTSVTTDPNRTVNPADVKAYREQHPGTSLLDGVNAIRARRSGVS